MVDSENFKTRKGLKKRSLTIESILVVCASLYVGVTNSFMYFIPKAIRVVLLIGLPLGAAVLLVIKRLIKTGAKASIPNACIVLMFLIPLFWRNYTLDDSGLMGMYGIYFPFLLFLSLSNSHRWHRLFLYCLLFTGLFYAVGTFVCQLSPNLYYGFIGPLMADYNPSISFNLDVKAGFTAHYSTNGMFLVNGVIASLSLLFSFQKEDAHGFLHGFKKFLLIAALVVETIAALICGKRGLLLCLVAGAYVAYFVYKTRKTTFRVVRLLAYTLSLLILFALMSSIIPSITNAIDRWLLMIGRDDVSTGRFELWSGAWEAFLEHPLLGNGWRWFLYHGGYEKDAHNVYLQLLCEVGVIGALPFFAFFLYSFYSAVRTCSAFRLRYFTKGNASLFFAVMYQTYFLFLMIEGTSLYNCEVLVPYLASCAMVVYYNRSLFSKGVKNGSRSSYRDCCRLLSANPL